MFSKTCIFILKCLIIYNQYVCTKAIVGDMNNIRPVEENQFPGAVCIGQYAPQIALNDTLICSGSFISLTHVVTAESCLYQISTRQIEIYLGAHDFNHATIYYPLWWLTFNHWATSQQVTITTVHNDIAIMKILGLPPQIEIPTLSQLSPVHLLYGLQAQIYGCGKINNGTHAGAVQFSNVRILSRYDCEQVAQQLFGIQRRIRVNMLCTNNNPYVQITEGDIGGPLVYYGTIVGINRRVFPIMDGRFNPYKINTHIAIERYRTFLLHVTLNL